MPSRLRAKKLKRLPDTLGVGVLDEDDINRMHRVNQNEMQPVFQLTN